MAYVEITKETWAFIAAHQHEDVRDVALHARRADGVDVPFALEQIAGRQRARMKLPDWAAIDGLIFPPQVPMEQCSSQFTALYKARLAQRLVESLRDGTPHTADVGRPTDASGDAPAGRPTDHSPAATSLIDLTGGFGVDCSAMARAFDRAVYVERQEALCDLARHNMAVLGLGHVRVVHGDAVDYLNALPADAATMVYADPARRDAHGSRTYAIADCTPDVLALKDRLLDVAPIVMVKLSPMLDWRKTVADFDGAVSQVHLVSTGNECKELLVVLQRRIVPEDEVQVVCVNDGQRLDYALGEERDAQRNVRSYAQWTVSPGRHNGGATADAAASPTDTDVRTYLYEPNASLMKAGCFAVLSARFPVTPVAPNSHLFVSAGKAPAAGFPGRVFAVDRVSTMNKRELKATFAGVTQANVAVRNFPLTVAQLRNKLGLRDGGDTYVFATTAADGTHLLAVTHKA